MPDLCRICQTRRPRRACPGVGGDICAPCCGAEREVSVDCPLDCEYLIEARRHEKPPELRPEEIPNGDIRVSEQFLDEHQDLVLAAAGALFSAAAQLGHVIDYDVREALEALVRTYRTRQAGLIYESRPANPLAAGIQQRFEQQVSAYRESLARQNPGSLAFGTPMCSGFWCSCSAWNASSTTGGAAGARSSIFCGGPCHRPRRAQHPTG